MHKLTIIKVVCASEGGRNTKLLKLKKGSDYSSQGETSLKISAHQVQSFRRSQQTNKHTNSLTDILLLLQSDFMLADLGTSTHSYITRLHFHSSFYVHAQMFFHIFKKKPSSPKMTNNIANNIFHHRNIGMTGEVDIKGCVTKILPLSPPPPPLLLRNIYN